MTTKAERRCTECGAELLAATGSCPRCLLAYALEAPGEGAESTRRQEPLLSELQENFPHLEIRERIGEGGMGWVYRARHRELGRDIALKILAATVADEPRFAERFVREARALARLDHPAIVRVHDFGCSGGYWHLMMELVEGVNLRQRLAHGALAPAEALAIVPQLCSALQYAHEHGVVHRDIKPDNVLIATDGRVKLADFGLAKLIDPPADLGRTDSGVVMGTLHYMAPEQLHRPRDVDQRADIYSLGVLLYEMLTGELPLGRFQTPSQRVRVDVRIDDIVLKLLATEPERRYQKVAQVSRDLAAVADGAPGGLPWTRRFEVGWGGWLAFALVGWSVFWLKVVRGAEGGDWSYQTKLLLVTLFHFAVLVRLGSKRAGRASPQRAALQQVIGALCATGLFFAGGAVFARGALEALDALCPEYVSAAADVESVAQVATQTAAAFADVSREPPALLADPAPPPALWRRLSLVLLGALLWMVGGAVFALACWREATAWRVLRLSAVALGPALVPALALALWWSSAITGSAPREAVRGVVVRELDVDATLARLRSAAAGLGFGVVAQFEVELTLTPRDEHVAQRRCVVIGLEQRSPWRRWRLHDRRPPYRQHPEILVRLTQEPDGRTRVEHHAGWTSRPFQAREFAKLARTIAG